MHTPERSTVTVLIADDDTLVRGVLRTALSRAGYRVIEARDGADVIAASAEHEPDLVVLDINMPGGSMQDTLGSLRQCDPGLPVLVLSGHLLPPDGTVGPLTDFASKPIDLDDFLARVKRLLDVVVGSP